MVHLESRWDILLRYMCVMADLCSVTCNHAVICLFMTVISTVTIQPISCCQCMTEITYPKLSLADSVTSRSTFLNYFFLVMNTVKMQFFKKPKPCCRMSVCFTTVITGVKLLLTSNYFNSWRKVTDSICWLLQKMEICLIQNFKCIFYVFLIFVNFFFCLQSQKEVSTAGTADWPVIFWRETVL